MGDDEVFRVALAFPTGKDKDGKERTPRFSVHLTLAWQPLELAAGVCTVNKWWNGAGRLQGLRVLWTLNLLVVKLGGFADLISEPEEVDPAGLVFGEPPKVHPCGACGANDEPPQLYALCRECIAVLEQKKTGGPA